jgi:hypothetical protein
VRFFDEYDDDNEDIQHLVIFKKVREENDEIEKIRFTLNKTQVNKNNAGSVDEY